MPWGKRKQSKADGKSGRCVGVGGIILYWVIGRPHPVEWHLSRETQREWEKKQGSQLPGQKLSKLNITLPLLHSGLPLRICSLSSPPRFFLSCPRLVFPFPLLFTETRITPRLRKWMLLSQPLPKFTLRRSYLPGPKVLFNVYSLCFPNLIQ